MAERPAALWFRTNSAGRRELSLQSNVRENENFGTAGLWHRPRFSLSVEIKRIAHSYWSVPPFSGRDRGWHLPERAFPAGGVANLPCICANLKSISGKTWLSRVGMGCTKVFVFHWFSRAFSSALFSFVLPCKFLFTFESLLPVKNRRACFQSLFRARRRAGAGARKRFGTSLCSNAFGPYEAPSGASRYLRPPLSEPWGGLSFST